MSFFRFINFVVFVRLPCTRFSFLAIWRLSPWFLDYLLATINTFTTKYKKQCQMMRLLRQNKNSQILDILHQLPILHPLFNFFNIKLKLLRKSIEFLWFKKSNEIFWAQAAKIDIVKFRQQWPILTHFLINPNVLVISLLKEIQRTKWLRISPYLMFSIVGFIDFVKWQISKGFSF